MACEWSPNAAIRLLNMKHIANCRSNVGNGCNFRTVSMFYVPSIEQKGDVRVVWIPYAVCCARVFSAVLRFIITR